MTIFSNAQNLCATDGPANMIAQEPRSITELWGLTEGWMRSFFANPHLYIDEYFNIAAWTADTESVKSANDVLQARKTAWRESENIGKILVCLSYMIGAAIIHEDQSLKFITKYRCGFLNEISIGNDAIIADIFSSISNFTNLSFIFGDGALLDERFDMLFFIRHLEFRDNKPSPLKVSLTIRLAPSRTP